MQDFWAGFNKRAGKVCKKKKLNYLKTKIASEVPNTEHLWSGFNKRAAEVTKMNDQGRLVKTKVNTGEDDSKRNAIAAGVGTTGALAAKHSIGETIAENKMERAAPNSRAYKDFQKKLKPGDIIMSRFPVSESDKITIPIAGKNRDIPMSIASLVKGSKGGTNYHGMMYLGNGMVAQAVGQGEKLEITRLKGETKGQQMRAYRPEGAKKREVQKAVNFARKAKGTPYESNAQLLRHGASHLFGAGGPKTGKCKVGPKGNLSCTTLVTEAYPKQFKKRFASPTDIITTKGIKPVGGYGRAKAVSTGEKVLSKVLYPTARKAKWGALAGGAAYGLSKLKEKMDEGKGKAKKPTPNSHSAKP